MDKIKSLDDLRKCREAAGAIVRSRRQGEDGARVGGDISSGGIGACTLLVCGGTGCKASQSALIAERLKEALEEKGLEDTVQVVTTGCFGFCEKGPIVKVMPDNTFYTQVKP